MPASAGENGKAVILIDQNQYATNNPSFRTIEGTLDYFGYKYDILPYSGTDPSQLDDYNLAFAISPDTSTRANLILNYSQRTDRYVMVTDRPLDSYAAKYNLTFVSNLTVYLDSSYDVNSENPLMNKIPGNYYDNYTKYNLGTGVTYGLTTSTGDKLYLRSGKVVFINTALDSSVHSFDPQLIRNFLSIADSNLILIEGSCPYAQDLAILVRLDDFGGGSDYSTNVGSYLPWYNVTHQCTVACIMSTATASDLSLISGADLEPHSYTHDKLTTMSSADELSQIMSSVSVFNTVFGVNPNGFIPPGNFFDGDTTKILHDEGFRYCSVSAQQIGGIGMSYGYYFNPGDEGNDLWILGCNQQDPSGSYMPSWYFDYAGDRQFFLILDHPNNRFSAGTNDAQVNQLIALINRTTQKPGWYLSSIKDYVSQLDNAKKAYVNGDKIIVSSSTSPGLTFYKSGISSPIVIDGTTSTIVLRTDKTVLPALSSGTHTFTYSSEYPVISSFTNGQIITDGYYDIPSDSVHFSIRDTSQIYDKTSVSFARLHSGSYTLKSGNNDISQVTVNDGTATFSNLTAGDYVLTISTYQNTPLSANFSANVSSGYSPLTVKFTDTSAGFPTSWSWDFGDGTPNSYDQNPEHTFDAAGNYTVNLTVKNMNGTNSTLATITVNAVSQSPIAYFSATPTSGTVPLNVSFTDNSTGSPTSWTWDFGDGTPNSFDQNPAHSFVTAGNYTVNLTVTNANGINSTIARIIVYAAQENLIANFSATLTSGTVPLNVNFYDNSTGSPVNRTWNFGDGTTSTTRNPVHKYNKVGTFTVSLTVRNSSGTNITTKTNYISVTTPPLVADFSAAATSGTVPLDVSFTDNSTGTPTSRTWNFGDGTTSTTKNPVHKYRKTGVFAVSLTVRNAYGTNTTTKTNYINVTTPPLVADFSATSTSGRVPLTVRFTDKSSGSPTSWNWNFGDGTSSTSKSPSHRYSKKGKYNVSLTVSNSVDKTSLTKYGFISVV